MKLQKLYRYVHQAAKEDIVYTMMMSMLFEVRFYAVSPYTAYNDSKKRSPIQMPEIAFSMRLKMAISKIGRLHALIWMSSNSTIKIKPQKDEKNEKKKNVILREVAFNEHKFIQ